MWNIHSHAFLHIISLFKIKKITTRKRIGIDKNCLKKPRSSPEPLKRPKLWVLWVTSIPITIVCDLFISSYCMTCGSLKHLQKIIIFSLNFFVQGIKQQTNIENYFSTIKFSFLHLRLFSFPTTFSSDWPQNKQFVFFVDKFHYKKMLKKF